MIRPAIWLLLLVVCGSRLTAAEISRAQVERLLAGAEGSKGSAAALDSRCHAFQRQHSGDPRADYLCGLALLRQRRYAQAMPYLDRYLAAEPDDLAAARTHIWVRLQLRQFAPALEVCTQLIERCPQQPGDQAWEETARFAGTVLAYLESARPESGGDAAAKAALKHRMLKALSGNYLEEFDAGRQAVLEQIAELRQRDQQRAEQERQTLEQRKQELAVAADENRTEILGAEKSKQAGSEMLRRAQRKFGLAQHQAASLQVDRGRIAAQAVAVQARMVEMQRSLRDNGRGNVIVSQADALILNNLAITLAALNKQLFDIDRQLAALGQDAAQLIGEAEQGSRSVEGGQAAIERAEKHAEALEKQARQLERQTPRGSNATAAQQRLLSRYFESPVESEKRRVLTWFD
jgi:hypothetical protein